MIRLLSKGGKISHKDYTALLLFAEKRGDRGAAREAIAFYEVEINDDAPRSSDMLTALYEFIADETDAYS